MIPLDEVVCMARITQINLQKSQIMLDICKRKNILAWHHNFHPIKKKKKREIWRFSD